MTSDKIITSRILITGGAGFVGSHLTDRLLELGHKVVVIDNLSNGRMENLKDASPNKRFTFIKGDILRIADCLKATKNIDIIYHLACLGIRHSLHSPLLNHRVNAEGTLNILEAAKKNGVSIFFYISSSEIYGSTNSFPIDENALPCSNTVYGASKLAGEHYAFSYQKCYGLDTTVIRIFNNYGPRAHYENDAGELIPRSIIYILYNKQPIIFGDGSVTRDFFFVKDTALALSALLKTKDISGEIFNIGTGVEITIKALIKKILALMSKEELGIQYMKGRPADVPRLWVNPQKFSERVGFKPSYSFNEGLKETIAYYKEIAKGKNLLSKIVVKNWEIKQ